MQAEVLHEAGDGFAAERAALRCHDGERQQEFGRGAARFGRGGVFAAEEAGIEAAGFVHFDAARFKVGDAVVRDVAAIQAGAPVAGVAIVAVAFAVALAFDVERDAAHRDEDEDDGGDAQHEYGRVGHGSWSPSPSMSSSR